MSQEIETINKFINYQELLCLGKIANYTQSYMIGRGEGSVLSTSTYVILTNATVIQPSANTAMKIVSTSANDASAGTGVQQVIIEYMSSTWGAMKSETITMNGKTPVVLTNTDVYRIDKMYSSRWGGVDSGATGTITLVDNATGLIKYAQIDPGAAFFERAVHYVSQNKICVLSDISIGCTTIGGIIYRIFVTRENVSGDLVPRAAFSGVVGRSTSGNAFTLPISVSNPNNKRIAVGVAVKSIASNQNAIASIRYYEGSI